MQSLYTPERISQLMLLHRLVCQQNSIVLDSQDAIALAARIFQECGDGDYDRAMRLVTPPMPLAPAE
jgi:hypothetical protein